MDTFLDIAVLILIFLVLFYGLNFAESERKGVSVVWEEFATDSGWQILPRPEPVMEADPVIVIAGPQASRGVEVAGYRHPLRRAYPSYMVATVELNNAVGIVMQSGFRVRLLEREDGQGQRILRRVKSGERNFDYGYDIKGHPEGVLHKILASNDVQAAIKTIYPSSTLLINTAFMQVQGDQLAFRVERLETTKEGLRRFVEQGCALAEAIEKNM